MATYQEQIAKRAQERAEREKAEAERQAAMLSPEQVLYWRIVLSNMGIPFAMSMPDQIVQKFKDRIQERLNSLDTTQGPSAPQKEE